MAAKRTRSDKSVAPAVSVEKRDRSFEQALTNIERMAKDRIGRARDPFKTGCRIAEQIRKLAERVEGEVLVEGMAITEAAYSSADSVGIGIGVL
jgi:hypothetical protein